MGKRSPGLLDDPDDLPEEDVDLGAALVDGGVEAEEPQDSEEGRGPETGENEGEEETDEKTQGFTSAITRLARDKRPSRTLRR